VPEPIGVNAWVWHSPVTDAVLQDLAPRVAAWGFDVLELPLESPGDWQPGATAALLAALGLSATVCAAMGPGRDLARPDADVEATRAYLRAVVDAAADVGASVVGGPMYATTGDTWRLGPDERERTLARVAEGLRPVVAHAADRGITLALEPLNRYETSLINTVDQALDLVDRIGHGPVGLLLDSFHLNIEETDPAVAVRSAAGRVAHVQASGTTRGTPGEDRFDWVDLRDAVRAAGYEGPWCIESFTPDNEIIARAASIWRPLAATQDDIATRGLAHLQYLLER
jgi:D-psicose/D-tagatose/L-ribulose 3-epimerase